MSIFRLAFRRETLVPIVALLVATGASVGLVLARIAWTREPKYSFLIWNLFLAWLPLVFALLAWHNCERGPARKWGVVGFSATWLIFFPNSSYIFTDLIHLTSTLYRHFWVDLVLILMCAFTGLVLGFLSLFLMQSLVQRLAGKAAGWLFIAAAAGLSGVGVYVGRFLRFNSWDLLLKPGDVLETIWKWLANPTAHPASYFPILFAGFLLMSYVVLYGLTHLQHATPRICDSPRDAA